MKKMLRASEKSNSERKVIKASKSIDQMIDAFESKLDEMGVNSSTRIEGSDDVGKPLAIVNPGDENIVYVDEGLGFAVPGATFTLAEAKEYWNSNNTQDYILDAYDTFEEWFQDCSDWYSAYEDDFEDMYDTDLERIDV